MKDRLYTSTEVASYFLWEYTMHTNALDLWYCAEEIGFFLEKNKIISTIALIDITNLPIGHINYIEFVRHIAYRIYIFTRDCDHLKNWYAAERLLKNNEWVIAVVNIADIYNGLRNGEYSVVDSIRTERIRKHFS